MRKKLFYSLCSIGLLIACSSDPTELSQLQNRDGLYYQVNQEDPYSGPILQSNNDGVKELEGAVKDGLRKGEWITWYPNGQMKAQGAYVDGLKDGEWKYWKENGTAKAKENYKDGKKLRNDEDDDHNSSSDDSEPETGSSDAKPVRFGLLKAGFKDGAIRKQLNGEPYTGKVIDYHDNGTVKLKGQFNKGIRTGKWHYYSEAGNLNNTKQF
ncbi:MAG: hypothetical protein JKY42_03740 [Flavobacteriales bacterium]|nr:hypothetical protein [Flavobacteriales bacterium]